MGLAICFVSFAANLSAATTPTITWATPTAITYGTTLSATQLDATASVAGTFAYTPALGTTPAVGTDTLSVTFTPTDTTDYTTATATVSLVVSKATPVITWATPAAITEGTAISATQLNATASVAGTFAYTPASGTIVAVGSTTLSVTFTPTTIADYNTATKTVTLTVNPVAKGTTNTIPMFTGASTLGNSVITQSGGNIAIGVGTTVPTVPLQVNGTTYIGQFTNGTAVIDAYNGNAFFGDNSASNGIAVNGSGQVGIGTTTPVSTLDIGTSVNTSVTFTNSASAFIAGTPTLGTTLDSMDYVGEFRSYSGNNDRLLIGEHRTAAGSNWYTGAWRIQTAVDNAFTGVNGNNGYIELSYGTQGSYHGIGLSGVGSTLPDMVVNGAGNVGIGTSSPGALLEVNGPTKLDGPVTYPDGTTQATAWNGVLSGGDYAESVNVSGGREEYEPGDVLVIDPASEGNFLKSSAPYSTAVTGIYSTKPGVVGRRQLTARAHMKEEVPMAMTGIVPTKVSAENGAIKPGDLLVTSSKPGYAMKGTDRTQMLGAIIGKAIGRLDAGVGVIEAVVTLQ